MSENSKLLIVDSSVLPDVFLKVVKAKELLAKNIAKEYTENNKHKPTKDDLNEHSKF